MKNKLFNLTLGLSMTAMVAAKAGTVNIPDGCFQGISTNVNFPITGTLNKTIGPWSIQLGSVLNLGCTLKIGTQTALGGSPVPAAVTGTNELAVNLPLGAVVDANLSQVLPTQWAANSTYTLSAAIATGSTASLLSGSTLALRDGASNLSSLSLATVADLFMVPNVYQTVSLTYQTGNTAPTNDNVGIYLDLPSVVQANGSIYVDNLLLTVSPINIVLSAIPTNSNLIVSASGGPPSQKFTIITSTNLFTQPSTWADLTTNQFDANGNFAMQIPINHTTPYRFFRLVLQ